jgi:hypothetical protein
VGCLARSWLCGRAYGFASGSPFANPTGGYGGIFVRADLPMTAQIISPDFWTLAKRVWSSER